MVIAAGQRTAPIARWIGAQSRGRTRLVQLGRKGAKVAEHFDVVVTPAHTRMWPHDRRIQTLGPLNPVSEARLRDAAERWPDLLEQRAEPRVVVLVGGATPRYQFDENIAARIGEEVLEFARSNGGSLTVVTSRRTGDESVAALRRELGSDGPVVSWQAGQESPYLGYLAAADVLVVTGESESMLAEVASTGKPVYIYALPKRSPGLLTRWAEWIVTRAHSRPENNRGTTRPQQGLEYLCARLVAGGWVLPPRTIESMHDALYRKGIARPFGEPLSTKGHEPLRETEAVAARLKTLLAMPR